MAADILRLVRMQASMSSRPRVQLAEELRIERLNGYIDAFNKGAGNETYMRYNSNGSLVKYKKE